MRRPMKHRKLRGDANEIRMSGKTIEWCIDMYECGRYCIIHDGKVKTTRYEYGGE